jgi:hypothetical protein
MFVYRAGFLALFFGKDGNVESSGNGGVKVLTWRTGIDKDRPFVQMGNGFVDIDPDMGVKQGCSTFHM